MSENPIAAEPLQAGVYWMHLEYCPRCHTKATRWTATGVDSNEKVTYLCSKCAQRWRRRHPILLIVSAPTAFILLAIALYLLLTDDLAPAKPVRSRSNNISTLEPKPWSLRAKDNK
jgi:hypothetical protein